MFIIKPYSLREDAMKHALTIITLILICLTHCYAVEYTLEDLL